MIEFKCAYCDAEMSAPSSMSGKSETCPKCGLTAIVPWPPDPSGESPVEIISRPWLRWPPSKRTIILVSTIPVALLVTFLIVAFISSGPDGIFPPRSEVSQLLASKGYFPLNAKGIESIVAGRKVRSFTYVMEARNPVTEVLAKIELLCAIDDPSHVVAMFSAIPGSGVLPETGEGAEISELQYSVDLRSIAIRHHLAVWKIAEELSSIKYRWVDLEESRKASGGKSAEYLYRKAGFTMGIRERLHETTGHKPWTMTLMLLQDKTWKGKWSALIETLEET